MVTNEIERVSFLAASNILFANAGNYLDKAVSILNVILTVGQIGIATITIFYLFKKARDLVKQKAEDLVTKTASDLVKEKAADLVLKAAADLVLKTAEDLKDARK